MFSTEDQYKVFKIPKKHGGFRQIEAPESPEDYIYKNIKKLGADDDGIREVIARHKKSHRSHLVVAICNFMGYTPKSTEWAQISEIVNKGYTDSLKSRQRKMLQDLKGMHYISPFVHSFRSGHNVVTNAKGHVGAKYVLHIDASNFFPSITWNKFRRIVGTYVYSDQKGVSEEELKQCFCKFGDEQMERLPQGAPTSPWLSNVFLSRFDSTMARYMTFLGVPSEYNEPKKVSEYNYSRYADDITISGPNKERLWAIFFMMERRLVRRYGITLNRKKTRMMGPGHRKIVCGIVVNEKHHPKRRWRKNLRAEIHNQLVRGQELKDSTKGKIAYLEMCRNTQGLGSSEEIFMHRNCKVLEDF